MKWQEPPMTWGTSSEDNDKILGSALTCTVVVANHQKIAEQTQQAIDTCNMTQSSVEASAAMIEDTAALLKRLKRLS